MKRAILVGIASVAGALVAPPANAQVDAANGAAAGPGGVLITISPSGVRQVQQVLNRLGYFAGPITGVWDRASAAALLHFQEAHGLEPTGNLNFSSITGLGLWDNVIGDPLGNGHQALETTDALPPRRGSKPLTIGGEPLPSQRLTTTGGSVTGSNTSLAGQPTGHGPDAENGGAAANGAAANNAGNAADKGATNAR